MTEDYAQILALLRGFSPNSYRTPISVSVLGDVVSAVVRDIRLKHVNDLFPSMASPVVRTRSIAVYATFL